jgi:DNA repair protein RadC
LTELIAIGSIDFVLSRKRDILAPALEYSAKAIILLHNHPSGQASPSESDIDFTKELNEAARLVEVNLLDHIIISKDKYYSFRETGLLKEKDS